MNPSAASPKAETDAPPRSGESRLASDTAHSYRVDALQVGEPGRQELRVQELIAVGETGFSQAAAAWVEGGAK